MLNYFSLFKRDKPSLNEYLLHWYSAPLTWLSPVVVYMLLHFIKKYLSPIWKLVANCMFYLYSCWTALSSLETWNLIPNTELKGSLGNFDNKLNLNLILIQFKYTKLLCLFFSIS